MPSHALTRILIVITTLLIATLAAALHGPARAQQAAQVGHAGPAGGHASNKSHASQASETSPTGQAGQTNPANARSATSHAAHTAHGAAKPRAPRPAVPVVSVAFDPGGRLWRVRAQDGFVLVAHSADLGRSWSADVPVNREPQRVWNDGENRPLVASDGRGRVVVSYTQMLDVPMAGHVRFAQSTDGGRRFTEPLVVNTHREAISHRFQAMVMDPRGRVWLAWLDKRDQVAAQAAGRDYVGAAVYATHTDDGRRFAPETRVAEHSCECCRIALATDPAGRPAVLWRHVFPPNVRDHALAWLDAPAPAATLDLQRVSHDGWQLDGCPHHGPALAIAADGTRHVAWFSGGPDEPRLGYARSFDGGRRFVTTMHFGDPESQPGRPAVLSLGRRVVLAWKQFDGQRSSVLVRQSGDGGRTWSAPRVLASSAGNSDHPALLAHGGRAFLSWSADEIGHKVSMVPAEEAAP